jgi:hypothetical protein
MKNICLIPFLFFVLVINAQEKEKSKLDLYSNLFSASLNYTTQLSEKWSLQQKIAISNPFYVNEFEVSPLTFTYHMNEKWSFFGGPKVRYSFVKDDFYLGTQSQFSALWHAGARYDFNNSFFGEFLVEKSFFNKNFSQQNNQQNFQFSNTPLKLKIGVKF